MPDQPEDPIHYDMKVPPETKPGQHPGTGGKHVPDNETADSATEKDNAAADHGDQPHSGPAGE